MNSAKRKDYYQIESLQGHILVMSSAGYFILATLDNEWHSVNCDVSRTQEIKDLVGKNVLIEVKQLLDIDTDKPTKIILEGKIKVIS